MSLKVTLKKTLFFVITRISVEEQNHLFFEIKNNRWLSLLNEIRCFPPVSSKKGLIYSYKSWLERIKKYPIRSKTLLTSIKDGTKRRLEHPLS